MAAVGSAAPAPDTSPDDAAAMASVAAAPAADPAGGWLRTLVIRDRAGMRRWAERCRASGLLVGLVPTMGALHAGHVSLIRRARSECDRVVVSIFVNPLQFGPGEDFATYPRDLDGDLSVIDAEGADAVFAPEAEEMYPNGHATLVAVGGALTAGLEGAHRPGHFAGVALVVTRLLTLSRPDRAYFGAKDAQQCAVVRRLVRDLDLGAEVVVCPTVRDADGLALSSRNRRLSAAERTTALTIPRSLGALQRRFSGGVRDSADLTAVALRELSAAGIAADYVAIVDPNTFEPVAQASNGDLCVTAARVGSVRLLDGIVLGAVARGRHHSGDAAPDATGAGGGWPGSARAGANGSVSP